MWSPEFRREYNRRWMHAHRDHPEWVPADEVRRIIRAGVAERGKTALAEDYAQRHEVAFKTAWSRLVELGYSGRVRRTRYEEADRWAILVYGVPA